MLKFKGFKKKKREEKHDKEPENDVSTPAEVPDAVATPLASPASPSSKPNRHQSTSSQGSNFDVTWGRRKSSGNMNMLTTFRSSSQVASLPTSRTMTMAVAKAKNQHLGLRLVYQPGQPPLLDIVFVHGLGGHFQKTWSKNHEPEMFWPGLWLPHEQEINKARIFSFGYPADFRPGSGKNVSNITDFSKSLLNEMAFGMDDSGESFGIGTVPIVFVVHSMGGLVAKKAYLLSQLEDTYRPISKSISAIIFLATPHRGSGLAEILENILSACFQESKKFITDLNKGSSALEELNETFRHVAPNLNLWSFYETLPTKIAGRGIIVVDKESATLGYPKEISASLTADHHDVCKYSSQDDSNYISVRNAISNVVRRFKAKGMKAIRERAAKNMADITALLGAIDGPEEDLRFIRKLWTPGTCEWALDEIHVREWLDEPFGSSVTWYSAPPGNGKSVLASFLIDQVQERGLNCQYFFFRFQDQTKRSVASCLKSIAHQLAGSIPEFANILRDMASESTRLSKAEAGVIWSKVFESQLFNMDLSQPLYWVIDALDEAEAPEVLLDLFGTLCESISPVRVLFTSRKTESLAVAFDELKETVPVASIEKFGTDHNMADIAALVEKANRSLRGADAFRQDIKTKIKRQAKGNFLWVRLVLEELVGCHTDEDVEEVLNEIPSDMESLYQRMEKAILNSSRRGNRRLARSLFQWTICAHRALSTQELSSALPHLLDVKRTIHDVCGQFVSINDAGKVSIIHETARDYLTRTSTSEISVDVRQGHELLSARTVEALLDPELREVLMKERDSIQKTEPFVVYSATSWTYHLRHSTLASKQALDLALKFLTTEAVLVWIHTLALVGRLDILVKAARVFTMIANAKKKQDLKSNLLPQRQKDVAVLEKWSVDLVKIVGKFSKQLLLVPWAVYDVLPCVCPTKSIVHQLFYRNDHANITVAGNDQSTWDDSVARLVLPNNDKCWNIKSSTSVLAALGITKIYLWAASSFAELGTVDHVAPIVSFCMNKKSTRLATYGLKNTKLWSLPSGELLGVAENVPDIKAMDLIFADNDTTIIAATDDKVLRYLKVDAMDAGWQFLHDAAARDGNDSGIEDTFANSPQWMRFNADASQLGVAYRKFPLTVYSVKEPRIVGRCKRSKDSAVALSSTPRGWFGVDHFTWNPSSGHILGVYKDGGLFKWHPTTHESHETHSKADELAMSPDGQLFLTSDSKGTVTVWNFATMSKIYRLSSSDLVTNLGFAADSQRFFDIRGRAINVWEPNSLIRRSEGAESSESPSDTNSDQPSSHTDSVLSEAHIRDFEPVTALSTAPAGPLYCVGNEEGVVEVHNAITGLKTEVTTFFNFQGISHIAWGRNLLLAVADLSGEIRIIQLKSSTNSGIAVQSEYTAKVDLAERGIRQLLLNHELGLLAVVSSDFAQIWSISDRKTTTSQPLPDSPNRRWLQHPSNANRLISFGPSDAIVYNWSNLQEVTRYTFQEARTRHNSQNIAPEDVVVDSPSWILPAGQSIVTKANLTQDERRILVQVRTVSAKGSISKRVMTFDNAGLDRTEDETGVLIYHPIPEDILKEHVDIPLGVLPGGRFVFLDRDLWICTLNLQMPHGDEALKRFCFVPRDWATTEALELCSLMADGTLLCPKNDRVSAIRADLDFPRL